MNTLALRRSCAQACGVIRTGTVWLQTRNIGVFFCFFFSCCSPSHRWEGFRRSGVLTLALQVINSRKRKLPPRHWCRRTEPFIAYRGRLENGLGIEIGQQ